MSGRTLLVRTDSAGDVLLAGPAVRAVAGHSTVTLLVSPAGEQAARLLPGICDLLIWPCPWSGYRPPPVDAAGTRRLLGALSEGGFDCALVLTSHHQSPLPMALLLRLAGIGRIAASSVDYPGSLLDLRHHPADGHESQRMLSLAVAAGFSAASGDDGRLAVRRPLPPAPEDLPGGPFVVVHPGASVPARAPDPARAARIVRTLTGAGWPVVVTGGPAETGLTRTVAAGAAIDLGGCTDLATLAAVLDRAACVVVGNTGPAHLAAAVGTPVVSLYAPVVPAAHWAPWGVPSRILGDQGAACRDSRARDCPVPGHPCLGAVTPEAVLDAVGALTAARPAVTGVGG
ncbi:MAG TPA: glycosyltransferase family 9 protein [Mycobacteriales bacterium]|nr:glycosyltransferase family 9 protein [Mycobacteriales bacterium]